MRLPIVVATIIASSSLQPGGSDWVPSSCGGGGGGGNGGGSAGTVTPSQMPESPVLPVDIYESRGGQRVLSRLDPRRTTPDGRLVAYWNQGNHDMAFRVNAPEVLTTHFNDAAKALSRGGTSIPLSELHTNGVGWVGHHMDVCDPDTDNNPKACTYQGAMADCYDVWGIAAIKTTAEDVFQLWGTPLRVTVKSPKSPRATVAQVVRTGTPRKSPVVLNTPPGGFFESVVSADGRVLFFQNINIGLQYMAMGAAEGACNPANWRAAKHLSSMHTDPVMQRYPIASFPLVDAKNQPYASGEPIFGAYPWVDRDVRNLFFTQTSATLYYQQNGQKIPRYKVVNDGEFQAQPYDYLNDGALRTSLSFVGQWSHGKVVVLDGRFNNVDYGIKKNVAPQVLAHIYSDKPEGTELFFSLIVDINSPESRLNYLPTMVPRLPRDVVWNIGATNMNDEIAFDDYIHPGFLILSNMNATVTNRGPIPRYNDGFDYDGNNRFSRTPELQNAATGFGFTRPAYGAVMGGARIEPIAAGGVKGKGLWLDGIDDHVRYNVAGTPAAQGGTWVTSLWFAAYQGIQDRRILSFPDGSWLGGATHTGLVVANGSGETVINLPADWQQIHHRRWRHVALVSRANEVDVYLNGYLLETVSGSYFRPSSGTITLGATSNGFRGWVDEFKVFTEQDPNPETLCNHAYGTVVGVTGGGRGAAIAGSYPDMAHQRVRALAIGANFTEFFCEQKFDDNPTNFCRDLVHPHAGATPDRCVRGNLHFPEGPMFHNRARPDSRGNAFCLSCHDARQNQSSLDVSALAPGTTILPNDPRRQPFQPDHRLYGWVTTPIAGSDFDPGPGGYPLDELLFAPAP